jgi:integrase/recombinase XerD
MTGLVSGLAPHIESLLAVKHALGLPYTTSGRHLQVFDAMCAEHYPEHAELTRPMAMAWAKARAGEHVNGQMRRITPVRQLAKHMAMLGVQAYVIPAASRAGRCATARTSTPLSSFGRSSMPPTRSARLRSVAGGS